jgi:hypothetical protein
MPTRGTVVNGQQRQAQERAQRRSLLLSTFSAEDFANVAVRIYPRRAVETRTRSSSAAQLRGWKSDASDRKSPQPDGQRRAASARPHRAATSTDERLDVVCSTEQGDLQEVVFVLRRCAARDRVHVGATDLGSLLRRRSVRTRTATRAWFVQAAELPKQLRADNAELQMPTAWSRRRSGSGTARGRRHRRPSPSHSTSGRRCWQSPGPRCGQ